MSFFLNIVDKNMLVLYNIIGDNMNIDNIKGIGPKNIKLLNKLNIYDTNDLLHYYPFRYDLIKRTNRKDIVNNSKVIIDGIIENKPIINYIKRKLNKIFFRINSSDYLYNIVVYNRNFLLSHLKIGTTITIFGTYNEKSNTITASDIRFGNLPNIPKIEPVYWTTTGLSKKTISKIILETINITSEIDDYIPNNLIQKYNFLDKWESIKNIHNPNDLELLKKARLRLKYEELFIYMLKINYLKEKNKNNKLAIKRIINRKQIENFINTLPYKLTFDQQKSINEIINDLESPIRMNRLLQGDVGSGKTIVSLISSYANNLSGYQTALMVPTELLARQHFETTTNLFKNYNIKVKLLTSSTTKKEKNQIYKELETGEIDLIIGTQSLIQEKIKFKNLGLVITDEQHRFGVEQRDELKNKGIMPDILSMSATPIPRTYALTIYGDLDISSIKTKPIGRKPIITKIKEEKDIIDVLTKMNEELNFHHQIYVLAPLIEDENNLDSVNVLEEKMKKAFPNNIVDSIHGKLDTTKKDTVMNNFSNGKIDILISTTVIEVGVDVKNATMMVIFDANSFGLSTIHQLRGRVGRNDIQSYCYLIVKEISERLKILEKSSDGFEISEYDFKNRGEGDLFGNRQSGSTGLILSNITRDYKILIQAQNDAKEFLKSEENQEKNPQIIKIIKNISALN